MGVAFQVLNDLKDWTGDTDNKLVAGQDALALRPTVLLALALKDADEQQKSDCQEILAETSDGSLNQKRIARLREIFRACDVFEKAEFFVERSREKAEALIADVEDEQIRNLLQFFIETVLARTAAYTARRNGNGRCTTWKPITVISLADGFSPSRITHSRIECEIDAEVQSRLT